MSTNTNPIVDGPAFGGSEYIDPREGIQTAGDVAERLAADRIEDRRSTVETAREHYRTLAATGKTYRAYGAARNVEGDFVAAWIDWASHGNDGPPPPHHEIVARLADQRENGTPAQRKAVTRYFTPDGTPRLRPAPIGRSGVRASHSWTAWGDHSHYADAKRPSYSGGDARHRKARTLWDGTIKTDAQVDRQRARLADEIDRGLHKAPGW